ncbi:MAG: hypothetical protein IJ544_08325 [Prevotella sp.]|nr:hypothetical protein [Prevotella sp.]
MKKIAFMFAAAALFAACTNTEKPATEAVENDSTVVEEAVEVIDSAAVWALVGDTTGLECDSICAKFEAAKAQLKAEAEAAAEVVEEAAEAVEAAAE